MNTADINRFIVYKIGRYECDCKVIFAINSGNLITRFPYILTCRRSCSGQIRFRELLTIVQRTCRYAAENIRRNNRYSLVYLNGNCHHHICIVRIIRLKDDIIWSSPAVRYCRFGIWIDPLVMTVHHNVTSKHRVSESLPVCDIGRSNS